VLQHSASEHRPLAQVAAPPLQAWPFASPQLPVALQVLAPVQVSASAALCTAVQVPGVALHVWQAAPHAPLQQKPSLHVFPATHSRQPGTAQSASRSQVPACAFRGKQLPLDEQ
jgi:hypothetical protein